MNDELINILLASGIPMALSALWITYRRVRPPEKSAIARVVDYIALVGVAQWLLLQLVIIYMLLRDHVHCLHG